MKLAIVNSRGLDAGDLKEYIPSDVTEIIIGRGDGASQQAVEYAKENGIPLQAILPKYRKYHRYAQKEQNMQIARYADRILAFWDGSSPEIQHLIFYCHDIGTPISIFVRNAEGMVE